MAARAQIIDHFKEQAGYCRLFGSPFTGDLLDAAVPALEGDSALSRMIGDWPGHPVKDALSLRVAGALHAAVLSGKSARLAAVYPADTRPGDGSAAWSHAEQFIADEREWMAQWLSSPPQTNEVRRACGLIAGLFVLAQQQGRPFELLELGASAGLNQNLDDFIYRNGVWNYGEAGTVVIDTEWHGAKPPVAPLEIASRAACDQNPLDVSRPEDRLKLCAYVWADQQDRLQRLLAAMELALERRTKVEKADAAEWIERKLARLSAGRTTVVYHSIFYQYPPQEVRQRIAAAIRSAGERATKDAPLAWLRFEPEAATEGPVTSKRILLDVTTWPGGERRILAELDPHGRFVGWI